MRGLRSSEIEIMLLNISRCAGVFLRNTLKPSVLSLTECHSWLSPFPPHPRDVAATRVRQKPEVAWSLSSPWSPDPPGLCDRGRRGEKSVEPLLFPTKRPYSAGETLVLYQYR